MAGKTNWNKGQQEVLDSLSDNRDILVSAAAGSGKTAVLVERIIRTIESGEADIDEILVVTFTKMAAAQMKGKIIKALEKLAVKAAESGDADYMDRITRQLLLADKANISTIDSFCNTIVKENFSIVDMDPSFDVFDKDEIELLKNDVLEKVLDDYYRDNEVFGELSQFLIQKNINDSDLKKLILRIFNVADSFADYEAWFEKARGDYDNPEDVLKENWVIEYRKYINQLAEDYYNHLCHIRDYFLPDINTDKKKTAEKIIKALETDIAKLRSIADAASLDAVKASLEVSWGRFPEKDSKGEYGDDFTSRITKDRNSIKKSFKELYTEQQIIEDYKESADYIRVLVDITSDFRIRLAEEKNRLRKYEFSDIAHAAYNILYDKVRGVPTEVGLRKASEFKYIYIDEYQDGSDLQENLLSAIARRDAEGNTVNIFMVGDIKQSIYRFRQARLQLFLEKSERYSRNEGGRLITLNMNYRSRREVLEGTNYIFEHLMSKGFGGTDYDDTVGLHTPDIIDYKNNYPDTELPVGGAVELEMINTSNEGINISEESNAEVLRYENSEIEALEIGRRIKEIVYGDESRGIEPLYVRNESYDSSSPEGIDNSPYRRATFGDIVILQRKKKGSEAVLRLFEQMEIPAIIEDASGFFDTMEIITLVSLLRIIDNQQQDIPLASVLLSHIGGFTDEELALVVSSTGYKRSLLDKCTAFAEKYENSDETRLQDIASRLRIFDQMIKNWQQIRPYITISNLIKQIVKDTDYEGYVMSMPDGRRRVANIRLLQQRAEKFEKNETAGLMDFIRYIDRCRLQEIDFAEDSDTDTITDSVRIMTIHKSKGLEFPIVFVARLGGLFNMKDTEGVVAVDSDNYLAMDRLRKTVRGVRLRRPGVKKEIIKLLAGKEVREEEMRLLYVAMTRAKEKLILVGTFTADPPSVLMNSRSYLDYIRTSMELASDPNPIEITVKDKLSVIENFRKTYSAKSVDYKEDVEKLLEDMNQRLSSADKAEMLKSSPYDFVYKWEAATNQKAKLSVSEIKHAEMESRLVSFDTSDIIIDNVETEIPDKKLCKPNSVNKAALRGTAIHAVFERLDYSRIDSEKEMKLEVERILGGEGFSDEERELVDINLFVTFYSEDEDSLFYRMKRAHSRSELYREQQFITGLTPDLIPGIQGYTKTPEKDFVVVQGIIDAFFVEAGEIILVDYKTDNVNNGQELLDRYAAQMYLYGLTIEQLTGKTVADCILYSTKLGEVHYTNWRNYLNER